MNILRLTILTIFSFTSIDLDSQSALLIQNTEDFIHELTGEDNDNDGNTCETVITLVNNSIMPQNYDCANSLANWVVTIDFWGDGTNDLQYTYNSPPDDDTFDDTNGDGIPDVYLAPTEIGIEITIVLPEIEGPMSNHRVSWKLVDDCNNVKTANIEILVVDRMPPTAVIKTEVIADYGESTMWGNIISLQADSLDLGSFDNCTSSDEIQFSFSEDISNKIYVVDCGNIIDTLTIIDVYVWDNIGNYSISQVNLFAYDPDCQRFRASLKK